MSSSLSPHLSSLRTEVLPYFPPSSGFSHPALVASACEILTNLRRLTAPGRASTRYALDKADQRSCLAAVASVIACERAQQQSIVTRRDAHKRSGASLRVFEGTLRLCREALEEAGSSIFKSSSNITLSNGGPGAITTQSLLAGLPPSPAAADKSAGDASSSSKTCPPASPRTRVDLSGSSIASKAAAASQNAAASSDPASPSKSPSNAKLSNAKLGDDASIVDAESGDFPAAHAPEEEPQGGSPTSAAAAASASTPPRSPRTPTKTRVQDSFAAASSSTSPSSNARASPLHRRLMRSRLETTPGKSSDSRPMSEEAGDETEFEGDLSSSEQPIAGPSRRSAAAARIIPARSARTRGTRLARTADNPFDDEAAAAESAGLDFGDDLGRSNGDLLGSPSRGVCGETSRSGKRKRSDQVTVAAARSSLITIPPISPWCSVKRPPPAFSGPTALLEPADPEGRVFALMPPPPERSSALASVAEEVYREALVAQQDAEADGNGQEERKDAVKQQRLAATIERLVEADQEAQERKQRKRLRRSRALLNAMMMSGTDESTGSEAFKIGSEWDRQFGFVRVKDQTKRSRTWVEKLQDVRDKEFRVVGASTPADTVRFVVPQHRPHVDISMLESANPANGAGKAAEQELPGWITRAETRGISVRTPGMMA